MVNAMGTRTRCKVRRVSAEPHRSADRVDTEKIAQFVDHRIGRVLLELGAVRFRKPANVAGKFDHGALHAKTDSEIRNLLFAGELNGADHSCDAAFAKATG